VVAFRRVVSRRFSPRHRALFLCLSTRSVEARKVIGRNGTVRYAVGGTGRGKEREREREKERVRERERKRERDRERDRERERGARPFRPTLMFRTSREPHIPILVEYVLRTRPTKTSSHLLFPPSEHAHSPLLVAGTPTRCTFHHPATLEVGAIGGRWHQRPISRWKLRPGEQRSCRLVLLLRGRERAPPVGGRGVVSARVRVIGCPSRVAHRQPSLPTFPVVLAPPPPPPR